MDPFQYIVLFNSAVVLNFHLCLSWDVIQFVYCNVALFLLQHNHGFDLRLAIRYIHLPTRHSTVTYFIIQDLEEGVGLQCPSFLRSFFVMLWHVADSITYEAEVSQALHYGLKQL